MQKMKTSATSMKRSTLAREAGILYSLYVLPGLFGSFGETAGRIETAGAITGTTVFHLAFVFLILYLSAFPVDFGRRSSIPASVTGAAGIAILLIVVSGLVQFVFGPVFSHEPALIVPEAGDSIGWIALTILITTTGLSEELFFRSYLLGTLRDIGIRTPAAIGISAAGFAVGHIYQGGTAVIFAFAAGVLLGVLWVRRPDLFRFALGHAAYNVFSLLISVQ